MKFSSVYYLKVGNLRRAAKAVDGRQTCEPKMRRLDARHKATMLNES